MSSAIFIDYEETRKRRRLPNVESCAVGNRSNTIPCETALYHLPTNIAARRMFSPSIMDSDAFLDMPATSQLLYVHMGMRADDEGFVGNPKRISRMMGAIDDDMKILVAKKFIIEFDSGVVVIKHWRMHNTIRMDRFAPTPYRTEKAQFS